MANSEKSRSVAVSVMAHPPRAPGKFLGNSPENRGISPRPCSSRSTEVEQPPARGAVPITRRACVCGTKPSPARPGGQTPPGERNVTPNRTGRLALHQHFILCLGGWSRLRERRETDETRKPSLPTAKPLSAGPPRPIADGERRSTGPEHPETRSGRGRQRFARWSWWDWDLGSWS